MRLSAPKLIFAAAVSCLLLVVTSPAGAALIDFEDLGVAPGTQFDPPDLAVTTSGGFDFVHGPASTIPDLHFPNASGNDIGGTTELLSHDEVIMSRNGGGTFDLNQFLWGSSFAEESFFTVEGTLSGGGTVSQVFFPDLDENTLQTFVLNATFTNLVSVRWLHIGGIQGLQNIDNILVDAGAVPEPATITLLGIGLGVLGLGRRRRAV